VSAQTLPKAAYSIPEAVLVTGVGRSRLYQEIASGRLRVVKCGRRTLVPADAVTKWLAALESATA
jgi:excisionase family DNA binding protein